MRHAGLLLVASVALFGAFEGPVAAGQLEASLTPTEQHGALLTRYCLTCHNNALMNRGAVPVSFEHLKLDNVGADVELWEQVVRKVRAGVMPPAGRLRPEASVTTDFVSWLEMELDASVIV